MVKVAFDFDDTLNKIEVKEELKNIITNYNIEVFIVTSRHNLYSTHQDIKDVCSYLGIDFNKNVIFTNYDFKSEYLYDNNINIIVDDCNIELKDVKVNGIIGIDVKDKNWSNKLREII